LQCIVASKSEAQPTSRVHANAELRQARVPRL